jgi:hypothetical protein
VIFRAQTAWQPGLVTAQGIGEPDGRQGAFGHCQNSIRKTRTFPASSLQNTAQVLKCTLHVLVSTPSLFEQHGSPRSKNIPCRCTDDHGNPSESSCRPRFAGRSRLGVWIDHGQGKSSGCFEDDLFLWILSKLPARGDMNCEKLVEEQ